jgi:hypothetical protein
MVAITAKISQFPFSHGEFKRYKTAAKLYPNMTEAEELAAFSSPFAIMVSKYMVSDT